MPGRSLADFPPDVISGTAKLIRAFVEDYHEKLEENQIFGGDGFEKNVQRVAELEKRLGVYDLA